MLLFVAGKENARKQKKKKKQVLNELRIRRVNFFQITVNRFMCCSCLDMPGASSCPHHLPCFSLLCSCCFYTLGHISSLMMKSVKATHSHKHIYPDMMFTSAKYLLHTLVLLSFFLFNCSGQIHAITLDNIRVFDYTEFGSLSQVNERSFQVIMASRRRGTAKLFQITKVLGKKSHDSEDHIPGILASSREEFDIEFSRMKS